MARIRNIKPEFFMSEDIGALTVLARLLYVALWTHADKDGKMKFQRTALAAQCMPFEMDHFGECLDELTSKGHVIRYKVGGKEYLLIPKFTEHQSPHHSEKSHGYPDPQPIDNGADTVKQPKKDAREGNMGHGTWEGNMEGEHGREDARAHECEKSPPDVRATVQAVLDHLNNLLKSNFPIDEATIHSISTLMMSGYRLEDFCKVNAIKHAEWCNDTKMAKYLRPKTLYGPKFSEYLHQHVPDNQKLQIIMNATGKSATEVRDMMIACDQLEWERAHEN